MCFLIIDLDCALPSSVRSNLTHRALGQRAHCCTQQLLYVSASISCYCFSYSNSPLYHSPLHFYFTAFLYFLDFCHVSCLVRNKDFSLGLKKQSRWQWLSKWIRPFIGKRAEDCIKEQNTFYFFYTKSMWRTTDLISPSEGAVLHFTSKQVRKTQILEIQE